MAHVTLRYWAAAKDAAGVAEQSVAADTLASALAQAGEPAVREALGPVLARSSFLVDGTQVGRQAAESVQLSDGAVIEVLPPFAGGEGIFDRRDPVRHCGRSSGHGRPRKHRSQELADTIRRGPDPCALR
jgi:molybdopterin synthase sulfur carrier subunit